MTLNYVFHGMSLRNAVSALGVALFLLIYGETSHGMETVWVSSTIFSKVDLFSSGSAIDLDQTPSGGAIGSFLYNRTQYNDASFEIIQTEGFEWKKTLVSSNTLAQEFNAELNTGHHVRMDLAGTTHVLSSVIKNDFFICKLVYANDSTGEWAFTTVVSTPGLQSIRSSALSLDSQGTPHVVYMTPTSLVYAHRVDETWQHETVFLSNNLSGPLSLTIDLDGNPIVGFLTFFPNNAGHLWKKNNLAWAPLATFPGAYHSHTHRIDSLNRIHTALVKVFPPQIHYARLAPDGSIQREMDVPVSGVTMDSRLDLALDQADVVYIVAHDVMVKINSWDLSIILCPKA